MIGMTRFCQSSGARQGVTSTKASMSPVRLCRLLLLLLYFYSFSCHPPSSPNFPLLLPPFRPAPTTKGPVRGWRVEAGYLYNRAPTHASFPSSPPPPLPPPLPPSPRLISAFIHRWAAYDKGYPFHMDNILPNVDTSTLRPQNIIAAPIWKGLGYQARL